jgi:hypothetical protein
MSFATQKLSCKTSCKTPLFFIVNSINYVIQCAFFYIYGKNIDKFPIYIYFTHKKFIMKSFFFYIIHIFKNMIILKFITT